MEGPMRLIDINTLKNGDRLGRSIYDDFGNMLLGKDVVLTPSLIEKVHKSNIYYVYISDHLSEGIEAEGILDDQTMIRSIQTVKSIMTNIFSKKNKNSSSSVIPLEEYQMVEDLIDHIIDELNEHPKMLYMVTELIGTDMYTYQHSVNVTVLSILTFKKLGYPLKQIKKLAMGALLHDIGKSQINNDLINKQEKLSDDEFMELKNHSIYGYEMVKDDCLLSPHAKSIIKLHHEKLDGTGYPSGLGHESIPEFVRVITICDMFDAMTTDRAYRKRMPIYKALELLMSDAVYKIDRDLYIKFIQNICVYPLGTGVKLSDHRIGIIKEYRRESPDRPVIRIPSDKGYEEVDLLNELTIFIEETTDI
jgi:putative nucleotidyltransferase with HDIG domain